MYQGCFEHNLDDKCRLAVPAPFRKQLEGDDGAGAVVLTVADQCLAAYPLGRWQAKLAQIARLNQLDPKVVAFKRIFIGCAHECPLDKGGRVLLPQDLRRHGGIQRSCVILGQLDKFEIWSAERWTTVFGQMADQIGIISASLAEMGVQL